MAALVKAELSDTKKSFGVVYQGPSKVADADETDLSTPDTSIEFDVAGVRSISAQVIFANYTSVTVKLQESLDGDNFVDVQHATTDTSNTIITASKDGSMDATSRIGPLRGKKVRLSIAGTLSASADTMEVWVYLERQPV